MHLLEDVQVFFQAFLELGGFFAAFGFGAPQFHWPIGEGDHRGRRLGGQLGQQGALVQVTAQRQGAVADGRSLGALHAGIVEQAAFDEGGRRAVGGVLHLDHANVDQAVFDLGMPVHEDLRAIGGQHTGLVWQSWQVNAGVQPLTDRQGAAQRRVMAAHHFLNLAAQLIYPPGVLRQQPPGFVPPVLQLMLALERILAQVPDLLADLLEIQGHFSRFYPCTSTRRSTAARRAFHPCAAGCN